MQRSRVVCSYLGVLALTSACATSSGTMTSSRYDVSPAPDRREFTAAERDSAQAQAIADREGPSVSVRADVSWVGNSRMLSGHFTIDQDAYVVVGQIDPQGIVRFLFPTDPKDDGYVVGSKSYTTNESFAGFEDEFNTRRYQSRFVSSGYAPYSYDRGVGYMFVIASWRPMHFDQVGESNDGWDSFEIADDSYLRDPRPAIYELASLLAGANREAYTVKFATYYNTTTMAYGGFGYGYSAFGYNSAYCPGASPLGFASSPFGNPAISPFYSWGESFYYRGQYYGYNSAFNCYSPSSYYNPFGRGFGGYIAAAPQFPPNQGFGLVNAGGHRTPMNPRPLAPPHFGHPIAPAVNGVQVDARHVASASQPHYNPQFRSRGLRTDDDPAATNAAGPNRRAPRVDGNGFDSRTRPSITQMVGRNADSQNEGRDWSRSTRISNDAANGSMRQSWAQRSQNEGRNSGDNAGRVRSDVSGRSYTPSTGNSGSGMHQRGSADGGSSGARNYGGGNAGSGGGARSADSPHWGGGAGAGVGARASSPSPAPMSAPVHVSAPVAAPASSPAPASSGPSKP